jgi:hypothetical protein
MKVLTHRSLLIFKSFFIFIVLNLVCESKAKESMLEPLMDYFQNDFEWGTNLILEGLEKAQKK